MCLCGSPRVLVREAVTTSSSWSRQESDSYRNNQQAAVQQCWSRNERFASTRTIQNCI